MTAARKLEQAHAKHAAVYNRHMIKVQSLSGRMQDMAADHALKMLDEAMRVHESDYDIAMMGIVGWHEAIFAARRHSPP